MLSACRNAFKRFALLSLGLLLTAPPALAQTSTPAPTASPQTNIPQVSVTGSVKKPGFYSWHRGLSVLELLAACGGPTVAPEREQATLVTRFGVEAVSIHLDTLLAGTDPAQNRLLLPGDTLAVASAKTGGQVEVTGQVAHPGQYVVPEEGLPILVLLNEAGGVLPGAALSRAQVRHGNGFRTISLRPMLSDQTFTAQDLRLFPGDTVSIPECGRVAVLGAVRHAGDLSMPDGDPLTVLNAITLMGGPNSDADVDKCIVMRHRFGKPTEVIRAGLKDQLLTGDTLVVPLGNNGGEARPWLIAGIAQGVTP